jgi:hypothetical protein
MAGGSCGHSFNGWLPEQGGTPRLGLIRLIGIKFGTFSRLFFIYFTIYWKIYKIRNFLSLIFRPLDREGDGLRILADATARGICGISARYRRRQRGDRARRRLAGGGMR